MRDPAVAGDWFGPPESRWLSRPIDGLDGLVPDRDGERPSFELFEDPELWESVEDDPPPLWFEAEFDEEELDLPPPLLCDDPELELELEELLE